MPPPADSVRAAGILLAAGASRRMGTNKMRLALEGEPLVRRAARRALEAGLSPLVVVLGSEAESVRAELHGLRCRFALNPHFAGPTSGSLHRGIESLPPEAEAAVLLLADMVAVTPGMPRALVAAARETGAPLVASRYGEVVAPPLLFRRALFPELLACQGDGCGKVLVRRHRDEAVFLDWPPAALTDVDTPDDFAAVAGRPG